MDKKTFEYKYSKYKIKYNLLKAKYISLQIKCGEEVNKFEDNEDNEDKQNKILIMGGFSHDSGHDVTNRVDMMIIDDNGANISWQTCAHMIKKRYKSSVIYHQGQALIVSSMQGHSADGIDTCEKYDAVSQTSIMLKHNLPLLNLYGFATAELNGKVYLIGGCYEDAGSVVYSDRVFCLDESDKWIEQEKKLTCDRFYSTATTYQNKIWVAGGDTSRFTHYSSIEIFDPDVEGGKWYDAGFLTKKRHGTILYPQTIGLFAIKDDLFAAGNIETNGMWVEKRDRETGYWSVVSEFNDGNRYGCALAACNSTIYFLGGNYPMTSWNSFNTRTNKWASQKEQYQDVATRQLPRDFFLGQAVCITPP